jgi:hypothetical protein
MQDLEEEIKNQMSKEIGDEIDFEIIAGMLVEMGWHLIELETLGSNHRAIDIQYWCNEHIKNKYQHRGRKFIFSNAGDAINFSLVWR